MVLTAVHHVFVLAGVGSPVLTPQSEQGFELPTQNGTAESLTRYVGDCLALDARGGRGMCEPQPQSRCTFVSFSMASVMQLLRTRAVLGVWPPDGELLWDAAAMGEGGRRPELATCAGWWAVRQVYNSCIHACTCAS